MGYFLFVVSYTVCLRECSPCILRERGGRGGGAKISELLPWGGHWNFKIVGGGHHERFPMSRAPKCYNGFFIRAQLFEDRLALNPGLKLSLVPFSCFQKHFLG